MYHIPLAWMRKEVGMQVGAMVGEVEDVDVLDDGVGWGEYLRVKICIDLSKPLTRGSIIKIQDKEMWIAFKYKKLPRFCFSCGLVLHEGGTCRDISTRRSQRREEAVEYGSWLRVASPRCRFNQGGWQRRARQDPRHTGNNYEQLANHSPWRSQSQAEDEELGEGDGSHEIGHMSARA
jgi:hypothetical protein